ncbi:hypothetical protein AtubIFM55763_002601 [Aspergillus tubingensis]|uniref:Cytochrome P450 n=1 Tax=Aspergillus tubingensis TaxID=5068 RepID=A0A9W6AVF7_ASPTU|nr:hypothetical protein AtubIFM55763_002601 [Aspergillus tubingensis]GLA89003.1 hypothetical protein AtubIFM56815_003471 [Aspergillus tubingensis]GLA99234.1 hypothetical protein AtubIFM57143_007540 [Aspergillus tubingensis]
MLCEAACPIVRVAPNKVHVADAQFYSEIYAGNSRNRDKSERWVRFLAILPTCIAATKGHHHHILRRRPLLHHFSKKTIREMEDRFRPFMEKLLDRIEAAHHTATPVDLNAAFSAWGTDTISDYCFGSPFGYLDRPGFQNDMRDALAKIFNYGHLLTYFPYLMRLRYILPRQVAIRLMPGCEVALDTEDLVRQKIREVQKSTPKKSTLVETLTTTDSLPDEEKQIERIKDECLLFVFAGTETTARALAVTIYHMLNNTEIYHRLFEEVKQVMVNRTDYPTWAQLEALPYLV